MTNHMIDNLLALGRITPLAGNMFDVAIFGRDEGTKHEQLEFPKSHLYCSAISFGSPELRFKDRHPLTKQQLVEGVQFQDTVTITWVEDQLMSVWNYHRTWFSYFYDRTRDQFRSGAYGKKRIAEVYLQEMKSIQSPFYENAREGAEADSIQHFLILEGLMPTKLPELSLGWDRDSSQSVAVQMTYRLDNIKYQIVNPRPLTMDERARVQQPFIDPGTPRGAPSVVVEI